MLRVLLDNVELDGDEIRSLNQNAVSFQNNFKAGVTVCRQFELSVTKRNSIPSSVKIYNGNNIYATLLVDSVDNENDNHTKLVLTDMMVQFNKKLTYEDMTVIQILQQICSAHSISLVNNSVYMGDQVISWGSGEITERDFISYVAEVNGGYAYINAQGNLQIAQYSNTSQGTVDDELCSNFKIGTKHDINRVYVELAEATHAYPQTTNKDTLYLNPDNILLSDSGDYTIDEIVQHIYSVVNGLVFYNVEVEKCPVLENVLACQTITIGSYPTLATIDWEYQQGWIGGYDLNIQSCKQEETEAASNLVVKLKRIQILVDREINQIMQQITELSQRSDTNKGGLDVLDTRISEIIQNADEIALSVSKIEQKTGENSETLLNLKTALKVQADGVYISQGTEGSYTKITEAGMDIYAEGVRSAYARVDGFYASDYITNGWHIQTANGNKSLNFIRKDYGE